MVQLTLQVSFKALFNSVLAIPANSLNRARIDVTSEFGAASNPRARYFIMLVPMFSMSSFLEIVSPKVFHRQAHFGHTHLFTKSSIDWMCNSFRLQPVSEWWFGREYDGSMEERRKRSAGRKGQSEIAWALG